MKTEYNHFNSDNNFSIASSTLTDAANLVLYFGERQTIENSGVFHTLKRTYPNAIILGCSTGGEIGNDDVYEGTIASLAVSFEKTELRKASCSINDNTSSFQAGETLAKKLAEDSLKGILVFSDGLHVNGSALVQGMTSILGTKIPISGGLAGDGSSFSKTIVGVDESPATNQVVAVGFYGDDCYFSTGSQSGWEPFGHERTITKSEGNVLYELDGKPALEVYKSYLGDDLAKELPGSALLFPLTIWDGTTPDVKVVRTVLGTDPLNQTMTFAGDVPQGYKARLMNGTTQHLVKGAEQAASFIQDGLEGDAECVAVLISCIGRKMVMGPRVINEIDAVSDVLGDQLINKIGFFSYGEISPHHVSGIPELHNQTMTIATFGER